MKYLLTLFASLVLGLGFAQEGFPVTVTDDTGREFTFDRPPERVIAMYNAGYGIVTSLGLRPVGQLANPEMTSDPRYIRGGESIPNLEGADGNADLEMIAELEPDLVVGGDADLAQSLESIVPVFVVDYPVSLEDQYADMRTVAAIFGLQDEVEARITQFKQRLAAYQLALPEQRPTTLIVGVHLMDEIGFMTGTGCVLLKLVSNCEWETPVGENGFNGTMETLLDLNPDVLIHGNWAPADGYDAMFAELAQNPLWNELSAVQNDRVIYLPKLTNPVIYGTAGATVMLDEFVPRIYPETFPNGALTDAQVQEILVENE